MDIPTRTELVQITRNAIVSSGAHEAFRNLPAFDTKADSTPVTDIDHAIQSSIFSQAQKFDLHLIGEEGGDINGDAKFALAVDPLDGTDAFIRGIPTSACAVTLLIRRVDLWFPAIAVIYELTPSGHVWSSQSSGPTWVKRDNLPEEPVGRPLEASAPYRVTISTWPGVPFGLDSVVNQLDDTEFRNQAFGSIALGAGLIASGGTHATVFAGKSALETVAMTLIVRGAGGIASDIDGNHLDGFALEVNESGHPDFVLPRGAIMASNHTVWCKLVDLFAK